MSASRFITRDYKSGEEGCVTKMLTNIGLPSFEERRRQQRLTSVRGHVPAINIQHYLRAQRPKSTIRAKQFEDFVKTNIVERSVCNNRQCFVPYKNSFFIRTTYDWNQLSESAVNCDSARSFYTRLGYSTI